VDWIKCITNRLLRAARRETGVTLIETVLAIAIFGVVSTALIGVLTSATAADGRSRQKSIALELAQQQVEYIRQVGYDNVCIAAGNPTCKAGVDGIPSTQEKRVAGLWYKLSTRIKFVDDPVPGLSSTLTNYKQVRIIVTQASDDNELTRVTTYVSSPTALPYGGANYAIANVVTIDMGTNEPLEGVQIDLWRGSWHAEDTTALASSGAAVASFAGLDPNPTSGAESYYDVLASLDNYVTLPTDLPPGTVPPGTATGPETTSHFILAASQTKEIDLNLYKPSTVTVQVMDGGSLYTAHSTTVTISAPSADGFVDSVTTTTGQASFYNVPPAGDFTVKAQTTDYRSDQLISQTVPEDYSLPSPTKNFVLTLGAAAPPAPVTVTVWVRHVALLTDSCEGSSDRLSSASVSLDDPDIPYTNSATTNSSGTAVFNGVPQGIYDFTASKLVYVSRRWQTKTGNVLDKTVDRNITVCVPIQY
jgi:type II secretory pathway pseudopilin PulG